MSERKQQILSTTAEILEQKSWAAFSYQDLADRLGIRKASIHHHFATKDELGVALLHWFHSNGDELFYGIVQDAASPGEALRKVFALAESVLLDGDVRVCPSMAFEVDADNLSPALIDALRTYKSTFCSQLAELLDQARSAGEITFLGDAHAQSATILCAMQGAQASEPIMGLDFFRSVISQLQRSLGL